VPLPVVHGLEVVDVDEDEGDRLVLPSVLVRPLRQLLLEGALVAEARQHVAQGVETGSLEELAELSALGLDRVDRRLDPADPLR